MASTIVALRLLLQALAEVRNREFYSLFVDVSYRSLEFKPQIGFNIGKSDDETIGGLGVGVSAIRADDVGVHWGVDVEISGNTMVVSGSVELAGDDGVSEVFTRSAIADTLEEAARLVQSFALEVCAQRHWLDADPT